MGRTACWPCPVDGCEVCATLTPDWRLTLVVPLGEVENDAPAREIGQLRRQAALGKRGKGSGADDCLVGQVLPGRAVLLRVLVVWKSQPQCDAITVRLGGVQRIQPVLSSDLGRGFQ